MGKSSRDKGARAELEMAEILREYWSAIEADVIFKRTPSSGGWGNKDARSAFRASGDLVTSSLTFPFCVEVKRREGWAWSTFTRGMASPIWAWWKQAIKAAKEQEHGPQPLLIFRKSREPWMVILPLDVVHLGPCELQLTQGALLRFPADKTHEGIVPVSMTLERFLAVPPFEWVMAARAHANFAKGDQIVVHGGEEEGGG